MLYKMSRVLAELRRANMQLSGLANDLLFVRVNQDQQAKEHENMSKQLQDLKEELQATRSIDSAIATIVYSYAQRMQRSAETAARKAAGIAPDPADSTEGILEIVREMKASAMDLAKAITDPMSEPADKQDPREGPKGNQPISTDAPVTGYSSGLGQTLTPEQQKFQDEQNAAEAIRTSGAPSGLSGMQAATLIPPGAPPVEQVQADNQQQISGNAETAQAQ